MNRRCLECPPKQIFDTTSGRRRPKVPVAVAPHAIGAAGRDCVKVPTIHRPAIDHVEDPDMLRVGGEHPARIRNIETASVRTEGETVRPLHVGDDGLDPAIRGDPIDRAGQLLLRLGSLVIRHDPIMRIAEPDRSVRRNNDVVRTVESLALEPVGDNSQRPVPFRAGYPTRSMFATDEPPLEITGVTVGVVRRLAIGAHAILAPANDPVVGNVGEQEAAGIAEPHRPFRPVEPRRQPLQRCIAEHIGSKHRIDDFEKRHG